MAFEQPTDPNAMPEEPDGSLPPAELDAESFFDRLDLQLESSNLKPEPAWRALTLGQLDCNPRLKLPVTLGAFMLLALAIGGYWNYLERQAALSYRAPVPQGMVMVRAGEYEVALQDARPAVAGEDAWAQLQTLMAEPDSNSSDLVFVSSSR